jgi:mannose-6-phosphate isomerase-like protein (cupin superfamily)
MFVTTYPRGEGPSLHLHPYPEVFLVEAGTARFTVGEDEMLVAAGNVVTVAAQTPHGFKNAGEGRLEVVSIHPSPAVQQTDLE